LELHLSLTQLLAGALDITLQIGGVEADEEIAFVDTCALGNKLDDLRVAAAERRPVRDRFGWTQRAADGQLRRQHAFVRGGRQRAVRVGTAVEGRAREGRDEHRSAYPAFHFTSCRGSKTPRIARRLSRAIAESVSAWIRRLSAASRLFSAVTTSRLFERARSYCSWARSTSWCASATLVSADANVRSTRSRSRTVRRTSSPIWRCI